MPRHSNSSKRFISEVRMITRARVLVGNDPIAPITIRHRPPISSNRLAIGRIVWLREVHLLWIVLEAFDLVRRIIQKGNLVFIASQIALAKQPILQDVQSELSN